MAVGEADPEVGARGPEAQRRVALAVEAAPGGDKLIKVRSPGGHRVLLVQPDRPEDQVPQPRHGLLRSQVREDAAGPGGRRGGGYGPGDAVAHGDVVVRLEQRPPGLEVGRHAPRISAREVAGVVGIDGQGRGPFVGEPDHGLGRLLGHVAERAVGGVLEAGTGDALV